MLFPILGRLFAVGMYAGASINDSHLSNTIFKKIVPLIFYTQLLIYAIALPIVLLFGTPAIPTWDVFVALLLLAMIGVGFQIPYYVALRRVDTSVVVAMFSLSRVLVPITAFFFLGERLSIVQYSGFLVIVVSVLALNFKRSEKKTRLNSAFFLMAIVAVLLSMETILKKFALNSIDWYSVLFWYLVLGTGVTLTFLLPKKYRKEITETASSLRKNPKSLGLMLMLNVPPMFSSFWSLGYLPASVHKAIGSLAPIFTLFFNWLMHKFGFGKLSKEEILKKDIARKLFFFAIIIIGVIMTVAG